MRAHSNFRSLLRSNPEKLSSLSRVKAISSRNPAYWEDLLGGFKMNDSIS
jgi:hypothetical protein